MPSSEKRRPATPDKAAETISQQDSGVFGKHITALLNQQDGLESYRRELSNAQSRLEEYLTTLRLADIEIERRNNALKALTAFSYQASRLTEPMALMRLTLAQALGVTKAQAGAIVLIDPETKNLSLGTHTGLTSDLIRILTGKQFEGGASALMPFLVSGQGALLEKHSATSKSEELFLQSAKLNSLISLPLQAVHHLFGALVLGRQDDDNFSPVDVHFLIGITQEASAALESIYLRDKMWRLIENLMNQGDTNGESDGIIEMATEGPISILSPLSAQLAQVVSRIGGIMGGIFMLENQPEELQVSLVADYGLSLMFTSEFTIFSASDEVFPFDQLARRHLVVKNISEARGMHHIPLLTSFQDEGAQSLVATQFYERGDKAWAIFVAAAELNVFTPSDLAELYKISTEVLVPFLQGAPLQMAPPSSNVELASLKPTVQEEDLELLLEAMMTAEEEVQRHNADFAALNRLSELLNHSLQLDQIADEVVTYIGSMLGTDATWFYVTDAKWLDAQASYLQLQAYIGLSDEYPQKMQKVAIGDCIEGRVVKKNEPMFIEDTMQNMDDDCLALVETEKILALAAVPLAYTDQHKQTGKQSVVGVLAVGMRYPYQWQPRQIRLLTTIANQMSFVIKNAQLYAQMQARVDTLSKTLRSYIRKS